MVKKQYIVFLNKAFEQQLDATCMIGAIQFAIPELANELEKVFQKLREANGNLERGIERAV
jgi:hypothetical protein